MKSEGVIELQMGESYLKVTHTDGVRTTVCENRFEVIAAPESEINEQATVLALRQWMQSRKKDM